MNPSNDLNNLKSQLKIEPEKLTYSLGSFINGCMNKLEREGIIIGLSGGIDSSVVAALCKKAVDKDRILTLIMPDMDSEEKHIKDALHFVKTFGIETRIINISPYLKKFNSHKLFPLNKVPLPKLFKSILTKKALHFYERITGEPPYLASLSGFKNKEFGHYIQRSNAYYRIKHRIRMVLLYLYGELENRLVVGAANKTEYKIGFFVKHGCDDAADIMPIVGLYKTQVREFAQYLNIPLNIIEKAPSPDNIPGITDEGAIGISYENLDLILIALENGWRISEIADSLKIKGRKVLYVKKLIEKTEHMRKIYIP
jgi:NAD+ synthase